ncbi:MAG: DUF1501 domain-containing protein [Arenibacterium sp.]
MVNHLSRRAFLSRSAVIGCSAAASPILTPITLASAPWDTRLVVLVLRGGMDGLDAIRPYGARELRQLRGDLGAGPEGGAVDLDGFFAMHPMLAPLESLWNAKELAFVHAVSTPYRDKRSHFDGQDILEAGTPGLVSGSDGWLNRMLGALSNTEPRTAFALGHGEMKVLSGPEPILNWSPEADLALSPQAELLAQHVMQNDPAMLAALRDAIDLTADSESMTAGNKGDGAQSKIAEFAATQLRGDTRIVSFSVNGWDTHRSQIRSIRGALRRLANTILTLQKGVGPNVWSKTAIVAMTEFGRTAALNGSGGTDHGTGGAMVLAGGAVRGGRVYGDWPGLAEADLYARRDLMATGDVRRPAAWILSGLSGLPKSTLENVVFPGLDMEHDPGILL